MSEANPPRSALSVAPAGDGVPDVSRPGPTRRHTLTTDDYVRGVLGGDRAVLARAITLIESNSPRHAATAQEVLAALMPHSGGAYRIGITGVPGVGKSTFIDAFGSNLTAAGHRVAVLAIDPSSDVSGGSILGDKTRMARLGADPNAFIRPSPTSGTLGGVARKTRESLFLCEAAGYNVVLVETVGVGQSETVVAGMTDFFLALMLPGAGDELQGIKRGLLEVTDLIAINKADGDNVEAAKRAAREYRNALHYMCASRGGWEPRVVRCSGQTGEGLEAIWQTIREHRKAMTADGSLQARRQEQLLRWMRELVDEGLRRLFHEHPEVRSLEPALREAVRAGQLPPGLAAQRLLEAFRQTQP